MAIQQHQPADGAPAVTEAGPPNFGPDAVVVSGSGGAGPDGEAAIDAELMVAVGRGDHDAFAVVYTRFGRHLRAVARQSCGPSRADEAVQEVFLRLWREPQRFDPSRGSLRTFLVMQTRGRAVDLVRRDGSRRAREEVAVTRSRPPSGDVEVNAIANLHATEVGRLLLALPRREREPITLAFYGGHTYTQVAALLHQPEGTVKGRIRSGLRHLHEILKLTTLPA